MQAALTHLLWERGESCGGAGEVPGEGGRRPGAGGAADQPGLHPGTQWLFGALHCHCERRNCGHIRPGEAIIHAILFEV